MPQVSQQHVQPLTMGFVGLLLLAVLGLGVLNKVANR